MVDPERGCVGGWGGGGGWVGGCLGVWVYLWGGE